MNRWRFFNYFFLKNLNKEKGAEEQQQFNSSDKDREKEREKLEMGKGKYVSELPVFDADDLHLIRIC